MSKIAQKFPYSFCVDPQIAVRKLSRMLGIHSFKGFSNSNVHCQTIFVIVGFAIGSFG